MIASIHTKEPPAWLLGGVFILVTAIAVFYEQPVLQALPFAALLLIAGWRRPRLSFYLLLLSLPFSVEYNFTPGLGTDIPDEGLMLLVSFLFLAYWVYDPSVVPKETLRHPLLLLLLLQLSWILLTTLLSSHTLLSVKYLLAKGWYLGAFVLAPLVLFRDKKTMRVAVLLLAIAMLAVVMISLLRHARLGFRFAMVNESVAPFFRNHVNYSSMLVCFIPVFYAYYRLQQNIITRYWLLAALVLLLAALFFSYARGAWLALGLGALAWWLIRNKKLMWAYGISIVLVVAAVFWLISNDRYLRYTHDYQTTVFHQDFRQHLVATYKLKDVSTAERFYRWVAGVRMVKDGWLAGFGPGTFYEEYKPYAIPAYKTWVSDNPEHSTVHNYFLLLLVEQGIPGLLFFLILLGAMLIWSQRLYHRVQDPFYKMAAIVTGSVLVMIATVNSLSDLIETDKVGSLFFLCLSLLVMIDLKTRSSKEGFLGK